jgi:hypothetical protein
VKNTARLLSNLRDIEFHENVRLTSFNIKNMYTNIPTDKIKGIVGSILDYSQIDDTKNKRFLNNAVSFWTKISSSTGTDNTNRPCA